MFLSAIMFEDPSFCGTFCAMILNNPMFRGVFNSTPLQNPMQQFSKTPMLCNCFLRPSAFQKPRRKISRCKVSTGRCAACKTEGHECVQLALGLLHSQSMPTPTAAESAQVFGGKPMVRQDQVLLCFRHPKRQ